MLYEPTLDKLRALRLEGMAAAWREQQKNPAMQALSHDERFALLVDAEHLHQDNKRRERRLNEAKLRLSQACIEDIAYAARRELDKSLMLQLGECRWVMEHHNILITGATGVGKTYIACALAEAACRRGYRALYKRVPRFLEELMLAHADGSYTRLLVKLARIDVLVLDDWGMAKLDDQGRRDVMEIIEDRYGVRSTILTSQLPTEQWHDYLGDPMVADAICDRLLHNAHRLVLKGPSQRKENKKK